MLVLHPWDLDAGEYILHGSAGIAGVSREWHLTEALEQLKLQQRLTLEHFEATEQLSEDLAYVRLGLLRSQSPAVA